MTVDDKGLIRDMNRFQGVFNKHVSRQLLGFGTFVKNEIKRRMRSGIEGPKLGVQQYIKGGQKLLVHTSGFLNAAKFKYNREGPGLIGIEVGWLGGSTARGYPYPKLAATMEVGREWSPKPSERLAVAIKARESGAPSPQGDRKEKWRIPPRPFLGKIVTDKLVLKKFNYAGEQVIERTLKEVWKKK